MTSLPAHLAIAALAIYKRTLSPVFHLFGARCRHLPTCSEYSADAFGRFGAHKGLWLTVSRLARCHPFGSHGFDPVPDELPDRGWRVWRYGDWSWRERKADGNE
ncbi:MAG: membrane protein insertion efficiency factor YidD [Parvularculaceae bacterium]|nr:membrane protein insertion efficiency factor YidD [Parvularculaceae bacterium]